MIRQADVGPTSGGWHEVYRMVPTEIVNSHEQKLKVNGELGRDANQRLVGRATLTTGRLAIARIAFAILADYCLGGVRTARANSTLRLGGWVRTQARWPLGTGAKHKPQQRKTHQQAG